MPLSQRTAAPFDNGRAKAVLAISIAFSVISTISVVLRFVGKYISRTKLALEDAFTIAAQIGVYGLAVVCILQVVLGGAGQHASVWQGDNAQVLKLIVSSQCLFTISITFTKISICLYYTRIFSSQKLQIASWTAIAMASAWGTGVLIYTFASCRPFAYFWDLNITGGYCVDSDSIIPHVIIGTFDALIDLVILGLPIPFLRRLQLSLPDKVALLCIFGAGICTVAVSFIRMHTIISISWSDVQYTGVPAFICTMIAPSIALSVACAPLTRPVFKCFFPEQANETNRRQSNAFGRLGSWELPSYVDRNLWRGRVKGFGQQNEFITTQVLESGIWSEAAEGRMREPNTRGGERERLV